MIIDDNNVLYVDNDNSLEIVVRNPVTNEYLNGGAVTVTLKDMRGTDVAGQTWPMTLLYLSASDGLYRGILEDTLQLQHDQHYKLGINIQGNGLTANLEPIIKAQLRRR